MAGDDNNWFVYKYVYMHINNNFTDQKLIYINFHYRILIQCAVNLKMCFYCC